MKLRDFNSGEAQKFNNNIRCIEIDKCRMGKCMEL